MTSSPYGTPGMLLVGRTKTGQVAHAIPAKMSDPRPLAHGQAWKGKALCGTEVRAQHYPFRAAAKFACKRCTAKAAS